MTTEEKIIKGYIEFELLNGRPPHSAFELTKKLKIEEAVFYQHYTSLSHLQQAIPLQLINQTLMVLDGDPNYGEFSAREKLLALFFTMFEQFQHQRSYLLYKYSHLKDAPKAWKDWGPFLDQLNARIESILVEAKRGEEIKDRPFIGAHYAKGYPLVFMYLFRVWLKDDSLGYSTTDAAIEKTVNLSFDMLGTTPLDSLLDFGKFALKTKVF